MSTQRHQIQDTSPASASTAVGSTVTGLASYQDLLIVGTLQGASGGVLDVYLQVYDGTDWIDYLHFPQQASGGSQTHYAIPVTRSHQREATTVTVGKNGTPALAADTCVGGEWGDRMRAVYVAGAGTTVGAEQTIAIIGTWPRK